MFNATCTCLSSTIHILLGRQLTGWFTFLLICVQFGNRACNRQHDINSLSTWWRQFPEITPILELTIPMMQCILVRNLLIALP